MSSRLLSLVLFASQHVILVDNLVHTGASMQAAALAFHAAAAVQGRSITVSGVALASSVQVTSALSRILACLHRNRARCLLRG